MDHFFVEYVASYSAPKGSSFGPGGRNVRDSSYDGTEVESLLVNGLGQLTDGILGEISEILTSSINDTNWVGWSDRATIQIVFRFQELREFQNCTVHVARIPQLHVEVRFSLSLGGSILFFFFVLSFHTHTHTHTHTRRK